MGQPVPVEEPNPADHNEKPEGRPRDTQDCPVCHGSGLWSGIEGTLYRCLACSYEMT